MPSDMLVGIITHDDAMDILRQEQTEDMLAFGGVSRDAEADEEPYWQGRIVEGVRRRIGWLLFLFLAGTITRYVSHHFNWVDERFPSIDFDAFVPLLIGTGGNAGSQTVGTIIRGLALGEIQPKDMPRVLVREGLTGLLLGLLLGTLGFFFTWLLLRSIAGLCGRDGAGDPGHLHLGQLRRGPGPALGETSSESTRPSSPPP